MTVAGRRVVDAFEGGEMGMANRKRYVRSFISYVVSTGIPAILAA